MSLEPLVSVIILGWGGEPYIAACLNALRRQTYRQNQSSPALEVIVVDNGSPDRTAEIVARDFPEVRLIRTGHNFGVAGGNNVGLKAARGEILVLINADVEVQPDWLDALVRVLQADPVIGIAGAKLLYPDGTLQFAGGYIAEPQGYAYHRGRHEQDHGQWNTVEEVDFITGASLALKRSVLEDIGYEDEKFFPIDYEDPDMCYRARAAGYRVVFVPDAVATHHESATTGATNLGRALSLEGGRLRFVCKHWTAEKLLETFLPAELEYLRAGSPLNRQVAQWVYLKVLYELEDLAQWRARLGLGSVSDASHILTVLLNRLRSACQPDVEMLFSERVISTLSAWFGRQSDAEISSSERLFLSLANVESGIEAHRPIAWPEWPKGIRPKVVAFVQKVIRRLLSWYINPMVKQQNEINFVLIRALETAMQEIALLQRQVGNVSPGSEQVALSQLAKTKDEQVVGDNP